MKSKKLMRTIMIIAIMAMIFAVLAPACFAATGDVSGAIEGTWNSAKDQIKTIVNNVVFPVIDVLLAVFFFVKIGTAFFEYRKSGQFEWAGPAILFASLVFTLTAPLYLWGIVGM